MSRRALIDRYFAERPDWLRIRRWHHKSCYVIASLRVTWDDKSNLNDPWRSENQLCDLVEKRFDKVYIDGFFVEC